MLRKVGALVASVLFLAVEAYAQPATSHVVLTNDQDFLVSNNKFLSGVYECSDGGYIDFSCITGQLPAVSCPDGYAIQSLGTALNPVGCVAVGGGSGTPAGADTYVQYNAMGIFGADQNFTWDYNNSILTLGGGGPGTVTFSGTVLASLGTPSDGSIEWCTDCTPGSTPCTGSGTGSIAFRQNGAWFCPGAGTGGGSVTGTGTATHLARWTSSSVIGDSEATDDQTTLTITGLDLSYAQALYITGLRSISTSVGANSGDRIVLCTSGSSTDKTYTMPAPTGTGRILDVVKVDSGTNACLIGTASGAINSGTVVTLPSQWQAETCQDIGSGQWFCRGVGTVS